MANFSRSLSSMYAIFGHNISLKDKYPNVEVGFKCILMVFPYLLLCSYINENVM